MSLETIAIMWDRVDALTAELPYWFFLLDLSEMSNTPPSASLRAELRVRCGRAPPDHAAVFTGKNYLLNVAAKFVLRSMLGSHQVTVHPSLEHGLRHLEALERKRSAGPAAAGSGSGGSGSVR